MPYYIITVMHAKNTTERELAANLVTVLHTIQRNLHPTPLSVYINDFAMQLELSAAPLLLKTAMEVKQKHNHSECIITTRVWAYYIRSNSIMNLKSGLYVLKNRPKVNMLTCAYKVGEA